jgi:hypothetical protein
MGHVVAPEPSLQGGGIWSHRMCGSTRTLPSREAESEAIEYMTACMKDRRRRQERG